MKIKLNSKWVLMLLIGITLAMVSCNNDDDTQPAYNKWSNSSMYQVHHYLLSLPNEPLSNAEMVSLIFMREEEKLARDVYSKLYEKWKLTPFTHIEESEQSHMDAIEMLLDKYNLSDPVGNNAEGIFINPTLQQLYNDLTVQGQQSLIEALRVGMFIEELDINDLQQELTNTADNQDIIYVYENLMKGSRNHLRAFYNNLDVRDVTYIPQVLSQEYFDVIINSDKEYGGF